MITFHRLIKRARYYRSALGSLYRVGGAAELARGVARIALRKPSDALRRIRWKAICGTGADRVILRFDRFRLAVDVHDEGIAAELALDHVHEPFGTAILLSILRDDMTVVELGANIGYYTMQEACSRRLRRVVAIEPNPVSFGILAQNVAMNGCQNIDLHNIAISDVDGTLPFYISKHSNICGIAPRADYERKIDVPVMRLDSLLEREGVGHVDMVRMDIEGHEIHALRGMMETLRRDKPWICMEYHAPMISAADREEFVDALEGVGYVLKCFTFRWSDYPIFGHSIVDRATVCRTGRLRDVLATVTDQVMLLFLAPEDAEFAMPSFAS